MNFALFSSWRYIGMFRNDIEFEQLYCKRRTPSISASSKCVEFCKPKWFVQDCPCIALVLTRYLFGQKLAHVIDKFIFILAYIFGMTKAIDCVCNIWWLNGHKGLASPTTIKYFQNLLTFPLQFTWKRQVFPFSLQSILYGSSGSSICLVYLPSN